MPLRLGDRNESVRLWRIAMNRWFGGLYTRLHGPLPMDTNEFGPRARTWQQEYERRTNQPVDGEVSDNDLRGLGIPIPIKPVVFTVEGHLANMFAGPCAFTAKALEDQGVCRWQPVGYDNVSLPFKNQSGIDELTRLLSDTTLLPPGTPWGLIIFSQGGIVGCEVFLRHIRPEGGKLHWRLKDLKGVIAFGNPYREKNVIAPWVPDPPKANTQGIADIQLTNTPEYWREVSRTGDLYAENPDNEVGLNCTAIYKIVSQSSWSGGPAGMLQRVIDLLGNPFDGFIDIAMAIIRGVMFVGNMGPHGIYDLGPCIDFMRNRLTEES